MWPTGMFYWYRINLFLADPSVVMAPREKWFRFHNSITCPKSFFCSAAAWDLLSELRQRSWMVRKWFFCLVRAAADMLLTQLLVQTAGFPCFHRWFIYYRFCCQHCFGRPVEELTGRRLPRRDISLLLTSNYENPSRSWERNSQVFARLA